MALPCPVHVMVSACNVADGTDDPPFPEHSNHVANDRFASSRSPNTGRMVHNTWLPKRGVACHRLIIAYSGRSPDSTIDRSPKA
jgi:hypothetical protein